MSVEGESVAPKYEVQNVRIVLDILQRLSASQGGERLSPFAEKLSGISKNRLFRMLCTLETEAFVTKSAEGSYRLGPAAYGLAKGILEDQNSIVKARPLMRHMVQMSGEAVYLAQFQSGRALLVDFQESRHKVRAVRCLGRVFDVVGGTLIETVGNCRVYVEQGALLEEVKTVSLVVEGSNENDAFALIVVAPSCRLSEERIRAEILPLLVGLSEKLV